MNMSSSYHFHKFQDDNPQSQSIKSSSPLMPMYRTINEFANTSNRANLSQTAFNPIQSQFIFQTARQSDSSPFPFSEIISLDFSQILRNGGISLIDPYLPKMLNHKFKPSSSSSSLVILLSSFQHLLNYLFSLQACIIESNAQLESSINSKASVVNLQIASKDKTISDNLRFSQALRAKQSELKRKVTLYRSVIYTKGYQHLLPNPGPLKIKHGNFYYCDLCANRRFATYDEVHIHYVKKHFKGALNTFNQSNENFQKVYFDSKLDLMKEELLQSFNSMNYTRQRGGDDLKSSYDSFQAKKAERIIKPLKASPSTDLKQSITINHYLPQVQRSSIRQRTVNYPPSFESRNMADIISQVDAQHEKNMKELLNEMNKFKQEIFDQISGLNMNKEKKVQTVVINQRRIESNKVKDTRSPGGEDFKSLIDLKESIKESNEHSIQKSDHFVIENKNKVEQSIIKNDSIAQVAPSATKLEELLAKEYEKYIRRDNGIINSKKLKTLNEIKKEYNIFNIPITKEEMKAINKEIKEKCGDEDFKSDLTDYSSDETRYWSIINNLLKKSIASSEKNNNYAQYKDNIYSITDLEKTIDSLSDDYKNQIYFNLDKKKVYHYSNIMHNENEFK